MKTFKVTVGRIFKKRYTCTGYEIINNPICPFLVLILSDERRIFVPVSKVITFSDEWFRNELELVKKQSAGQANIDHGLKDSK